MTSTQYIMGWSAYLLGATGCLLALWLITGNITIRLRRAIRLLTAVLLYTPWWTKPELNLLSPALLTMIYDGLSDGFEAMTRAGTVVVIASGAGAIIGLLLPVKQPVKQKNAKKAAKGKRPASGQRVRREPVVD